MVVMECLIIIKGKAVFRNILPLSIALKQNHLSLIPLTFLTEYAAEVIL